jgi:hypothetical protein
MAVYSASEYPLHVILVTCSIFEGVSSTPFWRHSFGWRFPIWRHDFNILKPYDACVIVYIYCITTTAVSFFYRSGLHGASWLAGVCVGRLGVGLHGGLMDILREAPRRRGSSSKMEEKHDSIYHYRIRYLSKYQCD